MDKQVTLFWGDSPMSFLRYMTLHSFRHFHPDWKIRLYTAPCALEKTWPDDEMLDSSDYRGMDWRSQIAALDVEVLPWVDDKLPSLPPNFLADMCRWKVLSEGGIFLGMDIVFCAAMDDHHLGVLSSKGAITCMENGVFTFGMAGSGGHSDFYSDCYKAALNCGFATYQSAGVDVIYGLLLGYGRTWKHTYPDIWKECLERYPGMTNIPLDWLFHFFAPDTCFETNAYFYPGGYNHVLGIHWYGGSKQGQHFNNLLTPDNLGEYNNPVVNCVKGAWNG